MGGRIFVETPEEHAAWIASESGVSLAAVSVPASVEGLVMAESIPVTPEAAHAGHEHHHEQSVLE